MSYPTWSDLNSPSIVPPLGARQAPDIGPAALMVSTEPDLNHIKSNAGTLDVQPFFTGRLFTRDGMAIAGPYIGAPYGVMLLESLIAKGAKSILILGWCGAVSGELAPGDLVVPDRAFVDEGTSRHYMKLEGDPPATWPDPDLSEDLARRAARISDEGVHRLPIWTTDAIYRETAAKVAWFREKGAHAVEMECAALFAAASYRGIPAAALLVVSDSLAAKQGTWAPGFRNKRFKAMRRLACRTAFDMTLDMIP